LSPADPTDAAPGPVTGASDAAGDGAPRLSVIVSCRNSASTLGDTLEAIVGQTYDGWWELVVVDNGSTDATSAVAQRFADRVEHFSLLKPPKPGYQALGLNYGIKHSQGEYLIFLDSDDLVAPGYLEQTAKALGDAPFVGGAMDVERLNPPWLIARRRMLQLDKIDMFCGYLPAVIGASMSARREAVEAVKGFDERLPTQHDLDISWRLYRAGYPATFVPGAVLHYRYRDGLKAVFDQELGYGEGEVALYRKFRSQGLRRRDIPHVLVDYARLLHALGGIRTKEGKARFLTLLGANLGRIKGSIRFGTLYL
jgi:glycosyltransferase involved in cell wall biosynthesis